MTIGAVNIAGAGMKVMEHGIKNRDALHGSEQPQEQGPQASHNAKHTGFIGFQKALANFVSKAPQAITAQPTNNAAEARRNFGSLMAKPQAA